MPTKKAPTPAEKKPVRASKIAKTPEASAKTRASKASKHHHSATPKPLKAASVSAETKKNVEASESEIAALAYSYWVERGHAHGSHEEDWLRAERELSAQ